MHYKAKYFLVLILTMYWVSIMTAQDRNCEKAAELMEEGNFEEAIQSWGLCLETDSLRWDALSSKALCYYKLGQYANAKSLFLEVHEKDSTNLMAIRSLASIYETEDHAPKAIKYYSYLIDLFPENPIFLRKKGQLLFAAGERNQAFESYSKAYGINPKDIHTVKGLVEILHSNGQFSTVDTILNAFRLLDGKNVNALLLSGRNKYKKKQFDSAVHFLKLATQEIDLSNFYHKMLGYSLMQIDSLDEAIYYLEKSLVNEGSPEHAHYYLGSAYDKKNEMETGIYHYKKAIETGVSDDIYRYHRDLARICEEDKNLKEAIKHYEKAYEYSLDPVTLFYLARASDVYYRDKMIAVRYYQKYLKSGHEQHEFKIYARDRSQYLKEQIHLQN